MAGADKPSLTLIFDFDGTLCDSSEIQVKILDHLAKTYGFKDSKQVDLQALKEMPAKQAISEIGVRLWKIPVVLAHARILFARDIRKVKVYPGVLEQLEIIHQRGIQLGVATSNSRHNVRKVLKRHFKLFDFVYGNIGMFNKKLALRWIIKKYITHNDPYTVVYIGDETRDIDAAKELGIHSAVVTWGHNTQEILKHHKPDFIVEKPEDLQTMCDMWG